MELWITLPARAASFEIRIRGTRSTLYFHDNGH